MLRLAVVFGEQAVCIDTMIARFQSLAVLILPQLFEQIHYKLREFERSLLCFGLGRVGIHAAIHGIT